MSHDELYIHRMQVNFFCVYYGTFLRKDFSSLIRTNATGLFHVCVGEGRRKLREAVGGGGLGK